MEVQEVKCKALTATERVSKSIKDLVAAGGKRLMLRLSPEGYSALKVVMKVHNVQAETQAINQVLIAAAKMNLELSEGKVGK